MLQITNLNIRIVLIGVGVLFLYQLSSAQNKSEKKRSIFVLKKVYEDKYQKKDSLGIMVRGKDTLIQITTNKPWPKARALKEKPDNSNQYSNTDFFVPIAIFKSNYKKTDSIGFIMSKNDTLIMVKRFKPKSNNRVKYELRDSTFLSYYTKVAFKYKSKDCTDTQTMKYWKKPIKIFFAKNVHNTVVKSFMNFVKDIDKNIDSLSITRVKKLEESNYVIFNNESYQYDTRINQKKAADYYIEWNGKSQITRGALRYDLNKLLSLKLRVQRIKELFIGSLGWFLTSNSLECDSFFANCYSDRKHMTTLDWQLLKYHYSYGICKGTTLKEFEKQHRESKKLIEENGGIINVYFTH